MICPNCRQAPITRMRFLLKPLVFRLRCRHCQAELLMSRSSRLLMAVSVLVTVILVRSMAASLGSAQPAAGWLGVAFRFLWTIFLPACTMALLFRTFLFRRDYRLGKGEQGGRRET